MGPMGYKQVPAEPTPGVARLAIFNQICLGWPASHVLVAAAPLLQACESLVVISLPGLKGPPGVSPNVTTA